MSVDVMPLAGTDVRSDRLADPSLLFTLYLGDVLLANEDRCVHGNVLGRPTSSGRLELVAIDQSDCFNHPSTMLDATALWASRDKVAAQHIPAMERALLDSSPSFPALEVSRIQDLKADLLTCVGAPADEWYERSGVARQGIGQLLSHRITYLETLAKVDHWKGLSSASDGGLIING